MPPPWILLPTLAVAFAAPQQPSNAAATLRQPSKGLQPGEGPEPGVQPAWRDFWRRGASADKDPAAWCPRQPASLLSHARGAAAGSASLVRASSAIQAALWRADQKTACNGTVLGGFDAQLAWTESCCAPADMTCTGCRVWAAGECQECAPGYMKDHGICTLCDDMPGWEDANGLTCNDYERDRLCVAGGMLGGDLPYKGLRPSQACCSCGGGETSPTPWRYPINNKVLLFGQDVGQLGQPLPRTSGRHEVQEDCDLLKLGLTFSANGSLVGTLPAYHAGETRLVEACHVTAVQDELRGLEMAAKLRVSVQAMSYGDKVIVIRFPSPTQVPSGQTQWNLSMAQNLGLAGQVTFSASCMPAAPWLAVDPANGTLSYLVSAHEHGKGPGLSGEFSGFESTQCLLTARDPSGLEVQSSFVVMKVFLWVGAYYPQTVFARKGRPIAGLQLWREPPTGFEAYVEEESGRVYWVDRDSGENLLVPPAIRPEVQAVRCTGAPPDSPVKWSKRTGLVTVGGQPALVVSPQTGDISGVSQVDLPARLGRASLTLSCAVALSGELYDYTMTVRMGVQLEDDTCWYEADATESIWSLPIENNSLPCSVECQARADCAMYWLDENGTCTVQTSLPEGRGQSPARVMVRSLCEEGVSCLKFKDSSTSFLEGEYCPKVSKRLSRCFRPTFHEQEVVDCDAAATHVMYTMRLKRQRFGGSAFTTDGHFVCVHVTGSSWLLGNVAFVPESTDVLVAIVDPVAHTHVEQAGTGGTLAGVRSGFASGDVAFHHNGTALTVQGKGFQAWECGGVSTAVFSREGFNSWEELYLARGPCPIEGRGGNWVVRRANETDYMNPSEGTVELRGEVLACIDTDIEREAFKSGTAASAMWMPQTAFQEEYYAPQQLLNNESKLMVTATLMTDSCMPPQVDGFLAGTVSDPDHYSVDACECFSEASRNEQVVTEESRKAVTRETDAEFNKLHPVPQLLAEGPYTCEDGSMLQKGQRNEISEEQCAAECRSDDACAFFDYVPQLRFCTLHQACERLGHTGLDITHRLFGIFDQSKAWCRIADPEACWAKKHRRALLAGKLQNTDQPCAFQHVLAQCDLLQMASTEAHGLCRKCEYYPLASDAANGLVKEPMPKNFPGGSQVRLTCGEDARLMSLLTRGSLGSSVLTCVGGKWVDEHGKEGTDQLACVDCVQVSKAQYSRYLLDSAPEVYLLSMRQLQYHHGVVSKGCRSASESTQAPLRSGSNDLCMQVSGTALQGAASCDSAFYITPTGALRLGGSGIKCLHSDLTLSTACSAEWRLDMTHRLRAADGRCLRHSGVVGAAPTLSTCSESSLPPATEHWYFDGGDCRYSMHLRSSERPLTFRYKMHGGAVLGSQTKTSQSGSSLPALLDPMAYGTCSVNIKGGLTGKDANMRSVLGGLTPEVPGTLGIRGMMFTVDDRTLFVCSPGGEGSAELISQYQGEIDKKKIEIEAIKKRCGRVSEGSSRCAQMPSSYGSGDWSSESSTEVLKEMSSSYYSSGRRRDYYGSDRKWKSCHRSLNGNGITFTSNTKTISWWSGWRRRRTGDHYIANCGKGYVARGVRTEWECSDVGARRRIPIWGTRRRRLHHCQREYGLACQQISGYNPNMDWTVHEPSNWANAANSDASFRAPDGHIIVGMKITHEVGTHDRQFKFLTVELCRTMTEEIEEKNDEIAVLEQKILTLSKAPISCAKDLELPVNGLPEIKVGYLGNSPSATIEMDARCHLLHKGLEDSDEHEDYALTAGQFSTIVRGATYHSVGASAHTGAPFEAVGAVKDAQNVGWFTMIDNGATLWGIHCEKGSVVAVHGEVFSPHCVSVGAGPSQAEVVLGAVVPGSGQCELGYAVGGWYNLPGVAVMRKGTALGGPEYSTGYKIFCREVPGLSRLCEEKESRCERDEVVTGLVHEPGLSVKYRCCKLPKIIGYAFADSHLHGVRAWEGYYCPTKLDETGRPEYALCSTLGAETNETEPTGAPVLRHGALNRSAFHLHNVSCKGSEVLTQFQVESAGYVAGTRERASFTCLKLPSDAALSVGLKPGGCSLTTGPLFSISEWGNAKASCPSGYALASFRLVKSGSYNARYSMVCCQAYLGSSRTVYTEWFSSPVQARVACGAQEAMTGWEHQHTWPVLKRVKFYCADLAQRGATVERPSYNLTWDKFQGVWKLWNGSNGSDFSETTGALASSAELPTEASHEAAPTVRAQPPGYEGTSGARVWIDGLEVPGAGSASQSRVVVLQAGSRKLQESQLWTLEAAGNWGARDRFRDFLGGIKQGRTVVISLTANALQLMRGQEFFQLLRCGGTFHLGQRAAGSYILVGVVGGQALAESEPDRAVEVKVPQLSVAPIVDFSATFALAVSQPDPFPKHRPLKPKLLSFSPKKPKYDEFCDLRKRTFELRGVDCEAGPDACPGEEHPCAHSFQYGITEQLFWDCQQKDSDREYVADLSEASQVAMDAEGSKLESIFDIVSSSVSLTAAAVGAIPWGSYAVPAKEGADAAVESVAKATEKISASVRGKLSKKMMSKVFKKIGSMLKGKSNKKAARGQKVADVMEKKSDAVGATEGSVKQTERSVDSMDTEGTSGEMTFGNDELKAIPDMKVPDVHHEGEAENIENMAISGWNDCQPVQFGISKMMCDLYCVENAVKEGDETILKSIKTSHTVLMTNIERLLDHHTQTLMWGMGQLRDQLASSGAPGSLLFFPGKSERAALAAGKLPDEMSAALAELGSLPKLLKIDLPENGTVAHAAVAWHGQASEQLLTSLDRVLEKHLVPGGDVKGAVKQAKDLVHRFSRQGALQMASGATGAPHVAQMTQRKVEALRRQIRSSQEHLAAGTPAKPAASSLLHPDPSVMAWFQQVADGFVAAHEQHMAFVQSRQRALEAAEKAVGAAEGYVGCEHRSLMDLHELWQKAYRLEDEAVKNLLSAWAASSSAREKLSLAVKGGLAEIMVERAPLPLEARVPCGALQVVAEHGHRLAVSSVDRAAWPLLEHILALERVSRLQERELKSKALKYVALVPLDEAVASLYTSVRDAADPETAMGKSLAARALDAFGPAACPAPRCCRHGGMLLLNSSSAHLWTSASPGELLLGKSPAEVARACRGDCGQALEMNQVGATVHGSSSEQSTLSVMMKMLEGIYAESQACGEGCAEHLGMRLTRKSSTVGQFLRRLR